MTVLVWTLQIVLAFLYLTGGGYKALNYEELMKGAVAFPREAWIGLGVFEIVGAVLLVVPAALGRLPVLTPIAAAALAVETLLLAAIYARYSTAITVENPMTWAIVMGVLMTVVAWYRCVSYMR